METRNCRLHRAHDIRIETETVPELGPGDVRVAVGCGGICGSDLHYFHDGGIGPNRIREPLVIGHEAAGHVVAVGAQVVGLAEGDRVAINPSLHCGACRFCKRREFNHCLHMRFMGSAATLPHEQGLFRDIVTIPAVRAHTFANPVPLAAATCSEPLAVCLHAAAQAPDLDRARVLIAGAGPIGSLMTTVVARANPAELVVTDLHDFPLSVATTMGAHATLNVTAHPEPLAEFRRDKGRFDTVFECTGSPTAIRSALAMTRPRGTLVMVGVAGDVPLPLNVVVSKEIRLVGTHRFHAEFADAVHMIDTGRIDVMPIVSRTYDLDDAVAAFTDAGDRTMALKVHLRFAALDAGPAAVLETEGRVGQPGSPGS